MEQYKNLCRTILEEGTWTEGRNGRTLSTFGQTMTFYMKDGFPLLGLREINYKAAIAEMKGFFSAYTNSRSFKEIGCGVWEKNANEEEAWLNNPHRRSPGDLGPVYGKQWRDWQCYHRVYGLTPKIEASLRDEGYKLLHVQVDPISERQVHYFHRSFDQVKDCLEQIMNTPTSRRILFHGWNPAENNHIALPACHTLYQFGVDVERRRLSLNIYLRSNDVGLGAPFNMVGAGFMLHYFALLTGYEPYKIQYTIGDAHLYENQIEMIHEMLDRENVALPTIRFSEDLCDAVEQIGRHALRSRELLDVWEPNDVIIENYNPHSKISVEMVA